MKHLFYLILLVATVTYSQSQDEKMLRQIYSAALTQGKCYSWLDDLSNKIGSRLSGSEGAEKGVQYTKAQLETLGLDRVYLQEVMVPHWVRGEKESAYILNNGKKIAVPICALGSSIATPKNGLTAEVIEVKGIKDLADLGEDKIKGKIVFFNRSFEPENIETFESYSKAVDQRYAGAREASKYGAVGTIIRSMTTRLDDFPHTGNQGYGDIPKDKYIPTAAISTNGAELLSKLLKENAKLKFYFKQTCQQLPDVLSYNVVGEIKGSEHPDQIMVVGGHLDSWDLADGSQDDGAGVVQSMEVAHIFKNIDYKPKNTLRIVLFMNEENGVRGGKKYEELSKLHNENHILAFESDSGGFSPRGFSIEGDPESFSKISGFKSLFEPYLIHSFKHEESETDIGPLTGNHLIKVGLRTDSQRYFDYHHAANDKFDAVNKRELELGAAAMASLIYLMDQ